MIKVQAEDFNIALEINELKRHHQDLGAIVSFTGVVRSGSGDQEITSMVLEHYPGMTQRELAAIEEKARQRWQLIDCLIIHRYGTLVPGDNIVLVVTISKHRNEAFQAASFLMDYLKTSAPFWKKELNAKAQGNWVKAKQQDHKATSAWQNGDDQKKS